MFCTRFGLVISKFFNAHYRAEEIRTLWITRAGFSLLERGVMIRKVTDVVSKALKSEGRTHRNSL